MTETEKPRLRYTSDGVLISDGLQNIIANLGTGRDKASHTVYVPDNLTSAELVNMYRTSWLAAAICDYPAEDATRKWRNWRAEAEQITKIEAEEKRLGLQHKVQDALIAARILGGSALY
ncbi:phage portal protein, partial [uncultured Halomonas sp.]|uniref:anti-CBASS protein Acb1 family protein n=1 Tax=uncultured Halomonas sp. TaxID=173971 RepID=UPI00262DD287